MISLNRLGAGKKLVNQIQSRHGSSPSRLTKQQQLEVFQSQQKTNKQSDQPIK